MAKIFISGRKHENLGTTSSLPTEFKMGVVCYFLPFLLARLFVVCVFAHLFWSGSIILKAKNNNQIIHYLIHDLCALSATNAQLYILRLAFWHLHYPRQCFLIASCIISQVLQPPSLWPFADPILEDLEEMDSQSELVPGQNNYTPAVIQ